MDKVYIIRHFYDVDGGFGDAIETEKIIAIFKTEEEAKEFVKKYENPHVYDTPYSDLYCGRLVILEVALGEFNEKFFWWLSEESEDD